MQNFAIARGRGNFDPTFVPPKGCTRRPRIYVVGEALGLTEVFRREPFVGHAGQILDKLIAAAGIDTSQVRFFDAIPFRPVATHEDARANVVHFGSFAMGVALMLAVRLALGL